MKCPTRKKSAKTATKKGRGMDAAVEAVFRTYPRPVKTKLLACRGRNRTPRNIPAQGHAARLTASCQTSELSPSIYFSRRI